MPTRRRFLAAAGCCLSLPWLEALEPVLPAAKPGARPARCVFIHIPYGVNMWRRFPTGFGKQADLGGVLAPLHAHRDRLTVFSGLVQKGSGGHGETNFFLTGRSEVKIKISGHAISIDQHIALARGHETGLPSLVLSMAGGSHSVSYDRKGSKIHGLCDLPLIYERLFGSPRALAAATGQSSVLGALGPQLQGLVQGLGREDARRLSQYTDALASVDAQLARDRDYFQSGARSFTRPGMELAADKANAIGREAYIDSLYDLAVLALQSDRTRIITIESPFSDQLEIFNRYPALIPPGAPKDMAWHASGHKLSEKREADTPHDAAFLANIDRYWAGKLARFLDALQGIEHEGGTLLDHTVVLFGSGMSWGNHLPDHLPLLIAGGSALGIRHHGHLGFNTFAAAGGKPANHSDLLRTLGEICGVPAPGFGDSTRVLDELLG